MPINPAVNDNNLSSKKPVKATETTLKDQIEEARARLRYKMARRAMKLKGKH
ncbi:hypothetical protein LB577_19390 [Mesorhizobium sp. B283B1A]|uniref:hypothetical protein n=1 Tax=Mesorhizobium TaxID=68287 RepID=UPI001CD08BD2|nr:MULTISPECIES: hypothetical protein [Mesorhizobium]MCA0049086.1 hypothetical protein [Mesorhizobium sp. B283B1A]UQS62717.1 hypothetical protein M5D98_21480 [Mesorhizobium opportunistum]